MKKRQFEIPYNFDMKLIDELKIVPQENIHCIFLSPFSEDYDAAKKHEIHTIRNGEVVSVSKMSREEYVEHVKYIRNAFPNKLMLLLQQTDESILIKNLDWYIQLGFTIFCCGNINQAKAIKEKSKDFEVLCSITQKKEPEDIIENHDLYALYYDAFVLCHSYNKDIDKIMSLPKDFKYSLLVNPTCSKWCPGTQHWFAKEEDYAKNPVCPGPRDFLNNIYVRPEDLWLFDALIDYYKFLGREWTTDRIMEDVDDYILTSYDMTLSHINDYKKRDINHNLI